MNCSRIVAAFAAFLLSVHCRCFCRIAVVTHIAVVSRMVAAFVATVGALLLPLWSCRCQSHGRCLCQVKMLVGTQNDLVAQKVYH
jgi:hypothetical protein